MRRYEINSPTVSGEIIDGEAIIMHLGHGHYFSAEGSGALLWAGIEQRRSLADLIELLAGRYRLDRGEAEEAVGKFLDELVSHDLVRPAQEEDSAADLAGVDVGNAYAAPRLQVYTDMQDLLLLDPIHDVDEVGWPVAAAPVRA